MLHRSLCALSVIGLHLTGGAPAAQHDTCVANGCTEHKQAAWSCQCNAYCSAHGDCCADAASVCLINATKSEVGGKPARHNSSEEAHSHAHNGTSPAAGHAAQKPASHPYAHNNATAPAVGKAPSKDGPKEPSRGGGGVRAGHGGGVAAPHSGAGTKDSAASHGGKDTPPPSSHSHGAPDKGGGASGKGSGASGKGGSAGGSGSGAAAGSGTGGSKAAEHQTSRGSDARADKEGKLPFNLVLLVCVLALTVRAWSRGPVTHTPASASRGPVRTPRVKPLRPCSTGARRRGGGPRRAHARPLLLQPVPEAQQGRRRAGLGAQGTVHRE